MSARQDLEDAGRAGGHWLSGARLRAYPQILLAVFAVAILAYVAASEGLEDPLGKPLGTYFSPFHAAAGLALRGEAAEVYRPEALLAAQQAAIPGTDDVFAFPQPPVFLLLILPLGLLPYVPGLIAWFALGYGSYAVLLLRRLQGAAGAGTWAVLAFPGAILCALNSQTGLLAVALLAAAVGLLPRRPLVSGLLFGLCGFRPELALAIGLALAAGGHWRTLAAAAASLAGLVAASVAAFGVGPWLAFRDSLPWLGEVLAEGQLPWFKLVSVYGAGRLVGLGLEAAVLLQVAGTLLALSALVWAWRRSAPLELKAGVLGCAALLISPLTLYYDLVLLALPLLWLALEGVRRGWRPWERELLAAAWALPLIAVPLGQAVALQVAPLVILLVLLCLLRRLGGQATAALATD